MAASRDQCRILESRFLDRFDRHVRALRPIYCPLDGATYDATGAAKREIDQGPEVRALLRRAGASAAYDAMPLNRSLVVEISKKPLLGPRRPVVDLVAASVSPLEELARGEASTPAGAAEISRVKERLVTQPKVFHYVAVFSPTGWAESARGELAGSNYVASLVDVDLGNFRSFVGRDGRLVSRKTFDLTAYPEKLDMVRALLAASVHELLTGEFTSDLVERRLGFVPEVVEGLFSDLVSLDRFLVLDARSDPLRLLREYARAHLESPPDSSELLRHRDALDRDDERIQCMLGDLEKLSEKEEELLEEGGASAERRRVLLAYKVKRLRRVRQDLEARLAVFQKRRLVTSEYVRWLELVRALRMEAVPDPAKIEATMAQASLAREKLKELAESALSALPEGSEPARIEEIMAELDADAPTPEAEPEPRPEPRAEEAKPPEERARELE